jgi:hypothetical protein
MRDILALLLDHALAIVAPLLLLMGRQAINHLADWLKLKADSEVRGYLVDGLQRAVEFGQAEARRRLLSVTSEVARERLPDLAIEIARSYAAERYPDALKRFGVDEAALTQMLKARMPAPARPFGG